MSFCRLYAIGLALLFFLIDHISTVVAEICTDGDYCSYPKKCCITGCCSIDRQHKNDRYLHSRAFKYTVWNVWYFWFILIFILMACFGGCGYYRKKRVMTLGQRRSRQNSTRERSDRMPARRVSSPVHVAPERSVYAYTGPAVDPQFFPPPYSEVVSKPDLYPVNKVDLPHYEVPPYNSSDCQDPRFSAPTSLPQPPPYSSLPVSSTEVFPDATNSSVQDDVRNVPNASMSAPAQQPAAEANNE